MMKRRKKYNSFSFTLIEILLSTALIGIIAAFSSPILFGFLVNDYLYDSENILIMSLKRAELLSQGNFLNSNFGVKFQSASITIFKGDSYASRDSSYDEIYDIPSTITITGLTEILFTKFSGYPVSSGNIFMTANTGASKTVVINSKGAVDY